jgi:hypothetical protein
MALKWCRCAGCSTDYYLARYSRQVDFGRKLRKLRKFKKQFIMVPADVPSSE